MAGSRRWLKYLGAAPAYVAGGSAGSRTSPDGGARGGERLRHPKVVKGVPSVSTPLHTPSTTGRRGTGAPTPGRQRALPRREVRSGVADQLSVGAVSATGRDPGPHPRQPSGPRRRNRLASEWEQRLRLDFQYSHRTLLPAAGSGQGGGGPLGESATFYGLPPLRWPQATVLGPPVAGHPRPGGALPQGHRAAQWAAAVHQLYVEARSFTHPQARWPGSGSCWSSASPSWLTR